MKNFTILVSFIFSAFCSVISAQVFSNGVYVLNEGGFAANNASVSFISNTSELQNNIFSFVNSGATLGDTAQHMAFDGTHAYIVLNGSGTIRVVNRYTFELEQTITGFNNPRYIEFFQGNLFVSCWGDPLITSDDYIAVIDTATNLMISNIAVAEGPERMILKNGKLYIAHSGGYGFGSSVSIVDTTNFTVLSSIVVGDVPNSLAEQDGILYVLSGGKPNWSGNETFGSLLKYDISTNTVVSTIPFSNQHPSNLKIDGSYLYYSIDGGVFKADLSFTSLPMSPLFTAVNEQGAYGIYGLDIIDSKIYIADAGNFVNNGVVYVYTSAGVLLNNFEVGIIPNGFYKAETNLAVNDVHSKLDIVVYPNPTTDYLNLNTDQPAAVVILDVSGRIVKKEQYRGGRISVLGLNKGLYLIEVTIQDQKSTKTIVIN